ncbi:DUF6894 family protein [Sphingomonas montanisoli]|uniref:DUF6894 domain-containing protein n=1 Tax=Sphingomonas montanisoli TaxID=2606412 RepID=A0A5D9C1Q3_9SPHN|nr:hypothetical protein [Sphingomonas montanisoli]TZG25798.1 hypothetical protein FYJ91_12445 [Sphingomonas montanisoli]
MPRYFLHLHNGVEIPDDTGRDFRDLAAAKEEAICSGREIIAEHVKLGHPIWLNHHIEIADGDGTVFAAIPFREIVTFID